MEKGLVYKLEEEEEEDNNDNNNNNIYSDDQATIKTANKVDNSSQANGVLYCDNEEDLAFDGSSDSGEASLNESSEGGNLLIEAVKVEEETKLPTLKFKFKMKKLDQSSDSIGNNNNFSNNNSNNNNSNSIIINTTTSRTNNEVDEFPCHIEKPEDNKSKLRTSGRVRVAKKRDSFSEEYEGVTKKRRTSTTKTTTPGDNSPSSPKPKKKLDLSHYMKKQLNSAIHHHQKQDYTQAINTYNLILKTRPDNETARYNRGMAYSQLGRYIEALDDFRGCPPHPDTLQQRGRAYMGVNKVDRAIQYFTKSLAMKPNSLLVIFDRANANMAIGRYQEAVEDFTAIIDLMSEKGKRKDNSSLTRYDIYHNRGVANYHLGKLLDSLEDYTTALSFFPNSLPSLQNRALVLDALGRHEDALTAIDQILVHIPNDHDTLFNRASILDIMGRQQEALRGYDACLQIKPNNPETLNNRGFTLDAMGKHIEAIEDYNKALEMRPSYLIARKNRGHSLEMIGRYEEAVEDLTLYLEKHPKDADCVEDKALALFHLKRFEESLEAYDYCIELREKEISRTQKRSGESSSALYTRMGSVLYNRALLYSEWGKYSEAQADLERSLDLINDDLDVMDQLVTIYTKQGEQEKADSISAKVKEIRQESQALQNNSNNNHNNHISNNNGNGEYANNDTNGALGDTVEL